jgi:nicotinate-nucleotide adenylyltransferase
MNKIGIFGGTFDPVHKGHEAAALDFYAKIGLDKLIIIPANIPPHKQNSRGGAGAKASQRLEMCRICFERYNNKYNIEVSDIEIKKEGVSYSYDTIRALREIYPARSHIIYFLVGSDMFLSLESWRRYKELLEACVFTVAFRSGNDKAAAGIFELREKLAGMGYKTEFLENGVFEISSTELREKIKRGDADLPDYMSGGVLDYIKERKIYVL